MKPKTIIPLVLGVVVGGIAIKIVVDVVNNAQGAMDANVAQVVTVKRDVDFAEEITPEMIELKPWPADSLPAQSFNSIEEVAGRVTDMHLAPGLPITKSMLAPPGTPAGIRARIKDGYRAVSVEINEVSGVAYQLMPGHRVDVVALVNHAAASGRGMETVSRIILQNIEIAAVGRMIAAGSQDGQKNMARSVTLLLKPEEVTILHLAQQKGGRISLALRGGDAGTYEGVASASMDQLLGDSSGDMSAVIPAPPPIKPVSNPQGEDFWNVNIIRGNNLQRVKYVRVGDQWQSTAGQQLPVPTPSAAEEPSGEHDFDVSGHRDYGESM